MINDIVQDTLGQIWVATNEGLFRYQGFEFQKFIKDKNNVNALHNNYVSQLYLDNNNNIWISTDDGIGRYSYELDIIERFMPEHITGRISSIAMDDSGNYYFGKYESGLMKVEGDSVYSLNLTINKYGMNFSNQTIHEINLVGDRLWGAAGDLGILCYNITDQQTIFFSAKDIANKEKLNVFEIYIDSDQRVWVGSDVGVLQLRLVDNHKKVINNISQKILPQDDYLTIYSDKSNNLWIGSRQNGMYTLSCTVQGEFVLSSHFTPRVDEFGISHRTVSKIFQEDNGFFWLGTHNGGINVFNPEGEEVRMVTKQINESEYSLNYQNVWGICESENGQIWIGTDGKGLSLLDPQSGKIQSGVIGGLEDVAILAAHEDTGKRLWLGTYSNGVFMYDKATGELVNFNKTSENSELQVNDIRCFFEDTGRDIYIGTNQGGLYIYDESNKKLKRILGVPLYDIRSIISEGGYLWLGTYRKGLIKYSASQNKTVNTAWSEHDVYQNEVIFDIYNERGILWVATRQNGVLTFDTKNDHFIDFPVLDEIKMRSISGIQMDNDNNLWFTTNTGIVFFDIESNKVQYYSSQDGFQAGHFNYGSIFCSQNGYIATGGIHGMNLFYPNEITVEPNRQEIIFNQIKIFDQIINPVNSKVFPTNKSIFLTDRIDINHSDNIFSIQFSLSGFTSHGKNDFIYKLDGFDEKWQFGTESNSATYRNVPPGDYVFKVKSIRSDVEKTLLVFISPPLWRTWPAYILYIFFIGFVIWGVRKFSNSRIALKQKLVFEQELRQKEHDIMQEKLRFYTNFSHELKTPLTLIQGPVNDLLSAIKDPKQRQYLNLIRKNTGIILKFIRRMLEFRKIEMNKTILNVSKHDLKILAQEEAESFGYLAKEKGIKFGFYCESELEAWVDLEKIQIVINNLLSNAFKYTPSGKTVNFGFYENESNLVIEVKDNGVGIRTDEIKHIFSPFFQASNSVSAGGTGIGLALCKSFVELHLGSIEVESEEGKGTKFIVKIPKEKTELEKKEYVRLNNTKGKLPDRFEMNDNSELDQSGILEKENEKVLLVVDDNKDISAYVKSLFVDEFKVLTAENGNDAFELALKNIPDIIISDRMMPGLNGIEFCKKIKNNISTSHIPLVLLTAKDSKQSKITGFEVGADDYITKPFSSEILIARVNNLLKNRQMLELRYNSNDLVDPESPNRTREVEFILKVENIILQMLEGSEFSVPQLCKELGMSQSALYRKIKSLTGVSIQIFIRKIRIKRSAQLLLSEDMTVSGIAFALDFTDLKYFRKCFKEQFGMTPSEFKVTHSAKPDETKIQIDSI
ncbi:MAG: ATP-binding protein [Cytophagales bacterium]|nr:ATP-binding protein [Cytophagales bacterium]